MSFTVALPLNHPENQLPAADRDAAVQGVADALQEVSGGPFGPGAIRMRWRFSVGAGFPVTALWGGELVPLGEGGLVLIELAPALTLRLRSLVPARYPVPRTLIIGPVRLDDRMIGLRSSTVIAGQKIGTLTGDTVEIGFLDADDLAIDPAWCLHLFDALRVWDLPDPASNPFQASAALPATVLVVPRTAHTSGAGITVHASSSHTKLIRPPANLNRELTSFLASETITIGLQGVAGSARWRLRVEDRTDGPGRSANSPFISPYVADVEIGFNPQRNLTPAAGPSTGAAAQNPLRYRASVEFEDGQQPPPALDLEQDLIDVLRQEYEDQGLVVPNRERFGRVWRGWETFEVDSLYQNDSYLGGRLGLDPLGLPQLVEALGHAFDRHLHPVGLALDDMRRYMSSHLLISDGYRNPRKNQQLGGARDHPSQYGFYVKLRPLADSQPGTIFAAVMAGSQEILETLRIENATRAFSQLELRLLDRAGAAVWVWLVATTGVQSLAGPDFPSTQAAVEANAFALGHDLELLFVPVDRASALTIPEPQPHITPPPPGKVSIIMYGSEVQGADSQIPLDDAAYTLRNWLKQQYPGDLEPEPVEVDNPVQILEQLGVFAGDRREIRFVFSLSHAYSAGLQLLALGNFLDWHTAHWPDAYVHSNDVREQMESIYGSTIDFGGDDHEMFATHQFRRSNLTELPRDMRRRLHVNLKNSEGVFLIGCKTDANLPPTLTITATFAAIAGVPVWGAADYSRFYRNTASGIWVRHSEERGQGDPNAAKVVLLPEFPGYDWDGKVIGAPLDLIEVYRSHLTKEMPGDETE